MQSDNGNGCTFENGRNFFYIFWFLLFNHLDCDMSPTFKFEVHRSSYLRFHLNNSNLWMLFTIRLIAFPKRDFVHQFCKRFSFYLCRGMRRGKMKNGYRGKHCVCYIFKFILFSSELNHCDNGQAFVRQTVTYRTIMREVKMTLPPR